MVQIECSICCESLMDSGNTSEDIRATSCGHIFHGACLNDWKSRSEIHTCPQCRTVLQGQGGTRLFFQMANTGTVNHNVESLSENDFQRGMELKATVRTAIGNMQKLYDEIEHISTAKTIAKDTFNLAADILKKIGREAAGSSDGEGTTQKHLKTTSQKISDALGHIAKFEEKMYIANKSLIDLAKQLNISGRGVGNAQKNNLPLRVNYNYLPAKASKNLN